MKRLITLLCLSVALFGCQTVSSPKANYYPPNGYVPDADTAIRIAESVWIPIYGKDKIESERPFTAKLSDNVWTVTGTIPEGWAGGTAEIEIQKQDGKILRVIHGK